MHVCSHPIHWELSWSPIANKYIILFARFARYTSEAKKHNLYCLYPTILTRACFLTLKNWAFSAVSRRKYPAPGVQLCYYVQTWEWLAWLRHDSLISKNACTVAGKMLEQCQELASQALIYMPSVSLSLYFSYFCWSSAFVAKPNTNV